MFTEYFRLSPPQVRLSFHRAQLVPPFRCFSLFHHMLYCVIARSLALATVLRPRQRREKLYLALCIIARYGHCVFRGLVRPQSISLRWCFALLCTRPVQVSLPFICTYSLFLRCASLRVSRRSFRDRNFCMCHRRRLCDFPEYLLRSVHVMSRR